MQCNKEHLKVGETASVTNYIFRNYVIVLWQISILYLFYLKTSALWYQLDYLPAEGRTHYLILHERVNGSHKSSGGKICQQL